MKTTPTNFIMPQKKPSAADAPDSRKEETMNNDKLTILYERLSHEDGRENESLSIEHQKEYLEEYATRNGFTNFVHRTDDGWSGTRWDRPGFLQIMEDIERGKVGQILVKDMSRLGRDHLRVGLFLEQLREQGVRLIAVAEGIDTAKGEDDFMPFRNIFAEWHARDTSRKIRAIFGARTAAGADPYKWATATLIQILKKEEYMGWKVLNKTTTESYKSKKREANPEKRLIFKDAHPAIIDEETWNVVQRLRETKRVRERISGEPNPLTGVLYCADCGQKMYHKQGSTGRPDQPHHEYVCSSYRHYSRSCTCHYIRVSVVESLVLEAIRRVSGYVRENEAKFIERVREKSKVQQEAAVKESRKKLTKAKHRREEISGLIKKLYEAYATGKIPENHFSELLTGYDTEQKTLDGEIERLQAEIERYNTDSVRADKFIELVKRHTEFNEFSASLLNEFVEKIIVHEATKVNGVREQEVEIHLNFIGRFDLPEQEGEPEETPVRKSKKKPRHEMTEEQRAILRERDRVRYARKVAAKKAAEEAQRAAILKGTAYEIRPQESGAAHVTI